MAINDAKDSTNDRLFEDSETNTLKVLEHAIEANSIYRQALERWIKAQIQVNYGKPDKEIVHRIVEKYNAQFACDIDYHDHIADALSHDRPIMAEQHRLLAKIYAGLSS